MRRASIVGLAAAALLAVACASGPPTPAWQLDAASAADDAVQAWLDGDARVEAQAAARMREAIGRTGRTALLARAELLRCAARVAALQFETCTAFETLRADAEPADLAYADYLAGRPVADAAALPAAQRAALQGGSAALAGIDDPLARLVAAGVLLRAGRADPALLQQAADTASAQGWRRAVLAWLGVLKARAEAAGDTAEAARLQRRIDLAAAARR
jgi:hypothetical protein